MDPEVNLFPLCSNWTNSLLKGEPKSCLILTETHQLHSRGSDKRFVAMMENSTPWPAWSSTCKWLSEANSMSANLVIPKPQELCELQKNIIVSRKFVPAANLLSRFETAPQPEAWTRKVEQGKALKTLILNFWNTNVSEPSSLPKCPDVHWRWGRNLWREHSLHHSHNKAVWFSLQTNTHTHTHWRLTLWFFGLKRTRSFLPHDIRCPVVAHWC